MQRTTHSGALVLLTVAGGCALIACRQEAATSAPDKEAVAESRRAGTGSPDDSQGNAATDSATPTDTAAPEAPATESPTPPAEEKMSPPPPAEPTKPTAAQGGEEPEQSQASSRRLMVDPKVNETILDLVAKWENVKSVSATLETSFTSETQKQQGEGTRDTLKRDGKILTRADYRNGVAMKGPDGNWITTGQIVHKVFDGQFLWLDDQRHEGRVVTKAHPVLGQIQPLGGRRLFAGISGLDELALLPDETVDGSEVYVFEGKSGGGTVTTRHYVAKDTGILLKSTREDSLAGAEYAVKLTDVKVNVEFDDGHFTYTPPEGVEVRDMTKRGVGRRAP